MANEQLKQMMLKFLERNYPISRVKYNKRFKRGIILDGGKIYIFNDRSLFIALQHELVDILCLVFYCDITISWTVLKTFLKLK